VALDRAGNLAAATSTAASPARLPGRSAIRRSSAPASTATTPRCAGSGTGDGELFLRSGAAFNVAARMRYRGESLARVRGAALAQVAPPRRPRGPIAVDRRGRIAMPFNRRRHVPGCIDLRADVWIAANNEREPLLEELKLDTWSPVLTTGGRRLRRPRAGSGPHPVFAAARVRPAVARSSASFGAVVRRRDEEHQPAEAASAGCAAHAAAATDLARIQA